MFTQTDFPSFSPSRYSSKAFRDKNHNRGIFEKLTKHFEMYGFPQPLQGRDVGPIRDWRFLSGDRNSRGYEVEGADKHIGWNFGRVLYWLICDAHRMPSGMAVIAYYEQHIALLRYLGLRFGYRIINAQGDLNMSGVHMSMNKKLKQVFDQWIIVMPSEALLASKRASSAHWSKMMPQGQPAQTQNSSQATGFPNASQPVQTTSPVTYQIGTVASGPSAATTSGAASSSPGRPSISSSVLTLDITSPGSKPVGTSSLLSVSEHPQSPDLAASQPSVSSRTPSSHSSPAVKPHDLQTPTQRPSNTHSNPNHPALGPLSVIEDLYRTTFVPLCNQFISNPPHDPSLIQADHTRLTEGMMTQVILKLDKVEAMGDVGIQMKKKAFVDEILGMMHRLDKVSQETKNAASPPSRPSSTASLPGVASSGVYQPPETIAELSAPYVPQVPHQNLQPPANVSELAATSGPQQHPAVGWKPPANVTEFSATSGPVELPASFVYQQMQVAAPATAPPTQMTAAATPNSPISNVLPADLASQAAAFQSAMAQQAAISQPSPAQPSATVTPVAATSANLGYVPYRPATIRRKAPPPPRKPLAKALYDFEPEDETGEELAIAEGDILEIVEKNKAMEEDGWCRARIKGEQKIGLVPLEYIEEIAPSKALARPPKPSSAPSVSSIAEQDAASEGKPSVSALSAKGQGAPDHKPPMPAESNHTPAAVPSKISEVLQSPASPASASEPPPPYDVATSPPSAPLQTGGTAGYFAGHPASNSSQSPPPVISSPQSNIPGQSQNQLPLAQPYSTGIPSTTTSANYPHLPPPQHSQSYPGPPPNSPFAPQQPQPQQQNSTLPFPSLETDAQCSEPDSMLPSFQPQRPQQQTHHASLSAQGSGAGNGIRLLAHLANPIAQVASAAMNMHSHSQNHATDTKHDEWTASQQSNQIQSSGAGGKQHQRQGKQADFNQNDTSQNQGPGLVDQSIINNNNTYNINDTSLSNQQQQQFFMQDTSPTNPYTGSTSPYAPQPFFSSPLPQQQQQQSYPPYPPYQPYPPYSTSTTTYNTYQSDPLAQAQETALLTSVLDPNLAAPADTTTTFISDPAPTSPLAALSSDLGLGLGLGVTADASTTTITGGGGVDGVSPLSPLSDLLSSGTGADRDLNTDTGGGSGGSYFDFGFGPSATDTAAATATVVGSEGVGVADPGVSPLAGLAVPVSDPALGTTTTDTTVTDTTTSTTVDVDSGTGLSGFDFSSGGGGVGIAEEEIDTTTTTTTTTTTAMTGTSFMDTFGSVSYDGAGYGDESDFGDGGFDDF